MEGGAGGRQVRSGSTISPSCGVGVSQDWGQTIAHYLALDPPLVTTCEIQEGSMVAESSEMVERSEAATRRPWA